MALIVPVPPNNTARIRFTTTQDAIKSQIIRAHTRGAVSHVEAVVDAANGGTIVAAQTDAGVQNRLINYDTWSTVQIFVDIPMDKKMYWHWIDFLWRSVGAPFDHAAFFGFAFPIVDPHEEGAMYCASFIAASLRSCGFFPRPLALKYHQITPVTVLLMLQAQPLERATIHPVETAA